MEKDYKPPPHPKNNSDILMDQEEIEGAGK